jgi:alpha/beta superfamily hydrolase
LPDVIFAGPAGRLEGRYSHAKVAGAPLAIVLHPAPKHGGDMNNAMTRLLYQAFMVRGFSVLRFNFRGVGRSEGEFCGEEGEIADAASALDWMQDINRAAPCTWVAGYSFGALVGMQLLMRRPEVAGFVSVAPPANLHDFTFLAPCPTPGLILQGGQDTIVHEPAVAELARFIHAQKGIEVDYRVISQANHFFHNCGEEVMRHVHDHLNAAGAGRRVPLQAQQQRLAGAA